MFTEYNLKTVLTRSTKYYILGDSFLFNILLSCLDNQKHKCFNFRLLYKTSSCLSNQCVVYFMWIIAIAAFKTIFPYAILNVSIQVLRACAFTDHWDLSTIAYTWKFPQKYTPWDCPDLNLTSGRKMMTFNTLSLKLPLLCNIRQAYLDLAY